MLVNGARGCPLCAAINYASIRLGHEYMCDRWLEHWQTAAQYLRFGTVHMIETCDFYLKINQTLIIDFQGTRFLTGHSVMIKIMAVWCNLKNIVGVHGKTATAWWRHQMETFSALLAICAGNSPVTGEIPTQIPTWRGALIFSLICAWINGWVNNGEAGDLRCHRAHYDVTVMWWPFWCKIWICSH